MGKFDGVLFFADYDDTLYNSAHRVAPEDRAAIRRFTELGGRFSVATGRAYNTFTPQIAREDLPLNAPAVLSNGAVIYDYQSDRFLLHSTLDSRSAERFSELCGEFPELALEAYHGDVIYVHNPNGVTTAHLAKVGGPQEERPIEQMPAPWTKVLLEQDEPYLRRVRQRLLERWGGDYEAVFSNRFLLEVTAKGCTKGATVAKVAQLLYTDMQHLYCMGDNLNDIPMLELAALAFVPGNCAAAVRDWAKTRSTARILPDCDHHAVAAALEILDKMYE